MGSGPAESGTLIRKRQGTEVVSSSSHQVKKIRRPKTVIDEDSYTTALSHIIARDFFPGLLESQTQQEYLDALDSGDQAWISNCSSRLKRVMTPGRRRQPASIRPNTNIHDTPIGFSGETPGISEPAKTSVDANTSLDVNMSLSKFQEKYTSEDNESFYQLVDRQNQKKADKYDWLWRGSNKLPSKQMLAQAKVLEEQSRNGSANSNHRLAIRESDNRPARPDTWDSSSKNTLMFHPDGLDDAVPTVSQRAEQASRIGPKMIVYKNTRAMAPPLPRQPPSPTLSSIRDAVAGNPRSHDKDSTIINNGGETPRVNGYAFVDDEDSTTEIPKPIPVINLGPGDLCNPYKLQETSKREALHEKMVEKIALSKKEAFRNGAEGRHTPTPRVSFPASPRVSGSLTPAAQRLWNNVGTPGLRTPRHSSGLSTPIKARESRLRNHKNK